MALVDDGSIVDEPTVTVEEFILDEDEENPDTKTVLSINNSGAKFTFVTGDRLGIFPYYPEAGVQMPFELKSSDASSAVFNCPGFSLRAGTRYAAYYPYNNSASNLTAIPVNYTGQRQTTAKNPSASDATFDISSADYLLAQATASSNACQFKMSHIGALVVLDLTVLDTGTYTELSLCSNKEPFVLQGTLDLSQSFTPTTTSNGTTTPGSGIAIGSTVTSNKISLALGPVGGSGISLTGGQTYRFCMMVYPVDLSGSLVTVKLKDSAGKYHHAITPSMYKDLRQGYAYRFSPAIAPTNLSTSNGADSGKTDTANCYIVDTEDVNAAGYKFLTSWAGNGYAGYSKWSDYNFANHANCWPSGGGSYLPRGNSDVTTLLNQNSCISNVSYEFIEDRGGGLYIGYIHFKASGNEGNAKIMLRDYAEDDPAWIWHIWCTDKPGTVEVTFSSWGYTYDIMDRNLGALTNGPDSDIDKMCGFYYQFGNPTGWPWTEFNAARTAYDDSWRIRDGVNGYKIKYADGTYHYIPYLEVAGSYYWFNPFGSSNAEALFGRLWGGGSVKEGNHNSYRGTNSVKTMYDPCPPGYIIAPSDCFGFSSSDSANNYGFYKNGTNGSVFFPYNGAAWEGTYFMQRADASSSVYCSLWSPLFNGKWNAFCYLISKNSSTSASGGNYDGTQIVPRGMGVRCVKQ